MIHTCFHRILIALVAVLMVVLLDPSPAAANDGSAEYLIKDGDNLSKIASRYGLTIEQLLAVNPQITDQNLIHTGSKLVLPPGRSEGVEPNPYSPTGLFSRYLFEEAGGKIGADERFYLVRGGDNMTRIARAYGITLNQLREANPDLTDFATIYAGQLVRIPQGTVENAPPFYATP